MLSLGMLSRSTRPVATSLLVLLLLLCGSGCTRSRSVTPWLRTSSYHPFELYAESGGGDSGAWSKTERRTDAGWATISESDLAMSLADGGLAVYVDTSGGASRMVLTNEAGEKVTLDCNDALRVKPDDRGLVCVATTSHWLQPEVPNTIEVTAIDLRGKVGKHTVLTLPANSLPRSFFPHFPGFLADGTPVLSAHLNAEVETGAFGREKGCAAFALRPDGVVLLKQLMTPYWPECGEARFWRDHASLDIRSGNAMLRSSD
jgi:hypothetical protein